MTPAGCSFSCISLGDSQGLGVGSVASQAHTVSNGCAPEAISDLTGTRKIAKSISESYLLRRGGTELR